MDKRRVPIEDSTLIRDMNSKALMETNPEKARAYMAKRNQLKQRFDEKDMRLAALEDELRDMKAILNKLLELHSQAKP